MAQQGTTGGNLGFEAELFKAADKEQPARRRGLVY